MTGRYLTVPLVSPEWWEKWWENPAAAAAILLRWKPGRRRRWRNSKPANLLVEAPGSGRRDGRNCLANVDIVTEGPDRRPSQPASVLMRDTACAGAGLTYLPEWFVQDDIGAGRLVRVLDSWTAPAWELFLYYLIRECAPGALRKGRPEANAGGIRFAIDTRESCLSRPGAYTPGATITLAT